MTIPNLAFLLLVLTSTGIFVVLLVGLVKQGIRVVRAAGEAAEQILPIVDEISQGADRAARHTEGLSAAIATIRSRG